MWFKRNGHRAKSHQNQSEVFDERKKKATKVHEGISAMAYWRHKPAPGLIHHSDRGIVESLFEV
jgi:hypothetical protein